MYFGSFEHDALPRLQSRLLKLKLDPFISEVRLKYTWGLLTKLVWTHLICHLLFYARAYLRKDNSCKNWSKGIIFTVFKRGQKAYCNKHRDLGKVINTWDDDQLNLIQKIQHTFPSITSTKCNGWKRSIFILQKLLRTTNPENKYGKYEMLKIWWIWKIEIWSEELVDGYQTVPYQPGALIWGGQLSGSVSSPF